MPETILGAPSNWFLPAISKVPETDNSFSTSMKESKERTYE